jgi:hypothetical protein
MNVYLNVAKKWAKHLPGGPDIVVNADWPALSCSSTSATLGSAGANSVWRDFPMRPTRGPGTRGAGQHLGGRRPGRGHRARDQFPLQRQPGAAGCLDGTSFYLGLDGNAPANTINFAVVLMHEVGHGLGFQALTSGSSGRASAMA